MLPDGMINQKRFGFSQDNSLIDNAFLDIFNRGCFVHHIHQTIFHNGPQTPGTGFTLNRLFNDRLYGTFC